MSTSAEVADLRCTICESKGARLCVQCNNVGYCSKACQRIDWPTHKLLCRSFSDFRVPPGPTFRRAILFPVHEKTPKFVWVEVTSEYNDMGDGCETLKLDGLLGAGESVGSFLYVHENTFWNRTLQNAIAIAHRDAFLMDGSLPNQSISKATRGEHAHSWAGPIVAFHVKGLDVSNWSCGDMTLNDFRHTVDYFLTYENEYYSNVHLTGVGKVKGVRISCKADQTMFGVDKYIPVDVESCHNVFRMEEPIGISKLIELPIFVRKCPPGQAWKNSRTAGMYTNQEVTFLHLDLDPKSPRFGWAPRPWDERVGSVLAVRADRKALSPFHMEALCHFCLYKLQPLIEDSIGLGGAPMTRDDVMRQMTKAKFKKFFRDYKAKQTDPSWTATPCPYAI